MPHEKDNGEGSRMVSGFRHAERRRPLFSFVLSLGRCSTKHFILRRAMHVLLWSDIFGTLVSTL